MGEPAKAAGEQTPVRKPFHKLKHGDVVKTKRGVIGKLVHSDGLGGKQYGIVDGNNKTHWVSGDDIETDESD